MKTRGKIKRKYHSRVAPAIRFYSIDSNNIFIKNNIKFLTFSVAYLNFVEFKDSLINLNYIKNDKAYAYLIKIRTEDGNFAMADAHNIYLFGILKILILKISINCI